jgi:hypothetical protein
MPEHNPNWQDTLMGGVIRGGFIAIRRDRRLVRDFCSARPQTAGKLSFSVRIGSSSGRPAPTAPGDISGRPQAATNLVVVNGKTI